MRLGRLLHPFVAAADSARKSAHRRPSGSTSTRVARYRTTYRSKKRTASRAFP